MEQVKAPHPYSHLTAPKLFLAGTIEMGASRDWQQEAVDALSDLDAVLLNPRRDDFDPNAEQSIHDEYFYGQVTWELGALEAADAILLYFISTTKSPISLLELGLFGRTEKLVVCCEEGYWRKGNVDIVCHEYGIEQVETLESAIAAVRAKLIERKAA